MKGSVWAYIKRKDSVEYRFQIDGIKRGNYTKVIDPIFKDWKEIASGVNYKQATETLIYEKQFTSDDEMISWVKNRVEFPTIFNKCNAKCTIKVLVADKNEVKDESKSGITKGRTVRKSKAEVSSKQ